MCGFSLQLLCLLMITSKLSGEGEGEKQNGEWCLGHLEENLDTAAIIAGVPLASVIILFMLWRYARYVAKYRRYSTESDFEAIEMKGLSEVISTVNQRGFNQTPNWWADIRIPEGVRLIPITDLKEIRPLGVGGFAWVYEVEIDDKAKEKYNDLCDRKFAVKIIYKEFTQIKVSMELIMKEIQVMKDLDSEFVVQLIGASLHVRPSLVMELVPGGSLENLIYNDGFQSHQTSLQWKLKLMLNISKGVQYLHSKGITHRDLKPPNVLIKNKYDAAIKISDFGLAKITNMSSSIQGRNRVGTIQYMAPEVCQGCQRVDQSVDIWALGVIMQEIVRGVKPWGTKNQHYIYCRLVQYYEPPDNGELPCEGYPQELLQLIRSCWKTAQERPSADEVMNKLQEILNIEQDKAKQKNSKTSHSRNQSTRSCHSSNSSQPIELEQLQLC